MGGCMNHSPASFSDRYLLPSASLKNLKEKSHLNHVSIKAGLQPFAGFAATDNLWFCPHSIPKRNSCASNEVSINPLLFHKHFLTGTASSSFTGLDSCLHVNHIC